jgi:hypothetical protein
VAREIWRAGWSGRYVQGGVDDEKRAAWEGIDGEDDERGATREGKGSGGGGMGLGWLMGSGLGRADFVLCIASCIPV